MSFTHQRTQAVHTAADRYERILRPGCGMSVDHVRHLLRQEAQCAGPTLTDAEVSSTAEALAKGQRIEVRADRVRLLRSKLSSDLAIHPIGAKLNRARSQSGVARSAITQ